MTNKVESTFKGSPHNNPGGSTPPLRETQQLLSQHKGVVAPGLRGLLLGLKHSLPPLGTKVADSLAGEPTGVLDLDKLQAVATEVYQTMLDTMVSGPGQTGLSVEDVRKAAWDYMQEYIARMSNDETYLQNALVTLTGVALAPITPVAQSPTDGTPVARAAQPVLSLPPVAPLATAPLPTDCPDGVTADINVIDLQAPATARPVVPSPAKVQKILPRDLTERQAEYCVTEATHLITSGPIAQKLYQIVSENGAKHSAVMEDTWIAVVGQLAQADQKALGNWIATHPKGQTQADRAIIETTMAITQSHNLMANVNEAQPGKLPAVIDKAVASAYAGTESVWEELSGTDEQRSTYELSRALMRFRYNVSADSVFALLASAQNDPAIMNGLWKEAGPKIRRDKRRKPSLMSGSVAASASGTPISTDGHHEEVPQTPLETRMMTSIDLPPVVQLQESRLSRAIARALTNKMGEYSDDERSGKVSFVPLELEKILFQLSRKLGPIGEGITMLEIDGGRRADQPMRAQDAAIGEFLTTAVEAVRILSESGRIPMAESPVGSNTLNRNERTAVMIALMSQVLAPRPIENDAAKMQARGFYLDTLLHLFDTRDQLDETVLESVNYAMRTIGLSWPKDSVTGFGLAYAQLSVNDPNRLRSMGDFASALGVVEPTEIFDPHGQMRANGWGKEGDPILVTTAAPALADMQLEILKHWDKLHLREKGNHTLVAELSRMHASFLVGRLAEELRTDGNPLTMYNLAAAIRFLYQRDESVQRQTAAILAPFRFEKPEDGARVIRFGPTPIFRPAEGKLAAVNGSMKDPEQLLALADLLRDRETGLLESSVRVISRLGTDQQIDEFGRELGNRLSTELELLLTTDKDSPAPLRHLYHRLGERLAQIQSSVRASADAMLDPATLNVFFNDDISAALMRRLREGTMAEELQALTARATEERMALSQALMGAQKALILPLDARTSARQSRSVDTLSSLYQGVMQNFVGLDAVMPLGALLGSKDANSESAAQMPPLAQIAGMLGAGAGGFALGKGEQARAQAGLMVGDVASQLAAASGSFDQTDAAMYRGGAVDFFNMQRNAIHAVADARIGYIDALMREATTTQNAGLYQVLSDFRVRTTVQAQRLNNLITSVQTALSRITAMRMEVLNSHVGEAEEVMNWIKKFESTFFPLIFDMKRAMSHGYGMVIPVTLPPIDELLGSPIGFSEPQEKA